MRRDRLVLLTTVGAKSGLRRTPMMFHRDGDRLLVMASNIGARRHPDWYVNLAANPRVTVEVGAESYDAVATPAAGEEREQHRARHPRRDTDQGVTGAHVVSLAWRPGRAGCPGPAAPGALAVIVTVAAGSLQRRPTYNLPARNRSRPHRSRNAIRLAVRRWPDDRRGQNS